MPDYYPETEQRPAMDRDGMEDGAGEQDPESTLVPLTAFDESVKVGDRFSGEVLHVYEDEVEVSIRSMNHKPMERGMKPAEMPSDEELDMMAKE